MSLRPSLRTALLSSLGLVLIAAGSASLPGCRVESSAVTARPSVGLAEGLPASGATPNVPVPQAAPSLDPVLNALRDGLNASMVDVGEARPLPTRVGATGGDWGIPSSPGYAVQWRIAEEDLEKASLEGNVLTAHVPGPLRLIATCEGHNAWLLFAVRAGRDVGDLGPGLPGWTDLKLDPVPFLVQDEATWKRLWEAAYTPPQAAMDAMRAVPTGPPPAPPLPAIDFSKRSLLITNVTMPTLHQRMGMSPVVTHIENDVLHVVVPDMWLPEVPSPAPTVVPPGRPTASETPWPQFTVFNVPKRTAGLKVQVEPFVAPAER